MNIVVCVKQVPGKFKIEIDPQNNTLIKGGTDNIISPFDMNALEEGIRLMAIGKIHGYAEGCACAMGMLSRLFMDNLLVTDNEVVIIDTEAGVEHFGRRVDAVCDMVVGVIEPSFESFMLAEKIEEMAGQAVP